ncbi:glycosyl hydrolase family 28-related protein [Sphingobium sp. HBC34]|uniref:Glycosyl hydrolase family 28-related protein n=1 Tax=Sphingobium cyanobacteriorum TaxID=3063954 RepID=A0ABT8ZJT3_9SPHN|nr:glycosyl hydrolase family 28-related protein [Sphingobium sp. HBC34]MDO7834785.1 glycosyl hydrolase family 28-related protein [Sphingobium sp. HBC34]
MAVTSFNGRTGAVVPVSGDYDADKVSYKIDVAAPGAANRNCGSKFRERVSVKDFGAVLDGSTNDSAAFQNAYNYCSQNKISEIDVPSGIAWIDGPILMSGNPVTFIGQSPSYESGIGEGSWIKITRSNFQPFTITGEPSRGSGFRHFGIYQEHPGPAANWAPTNYPQVFLCQSMLGEFFLEDIFCSPVNRLISSISSGRLNLRGIKGQFFNGLCYITLSKDCCRISDIHSYCYWTQDQNVLSYTQKNLDLIVLARVDTPFIDEVFSIFSRSVLCTVIDVPADGGPSKILVGRIEGDFSKYTIWNRAAGTTIRASSVGGQGEDVTQPGMPLTDAYVIRNEGVGASILISMAQGQRYSKGCILNTGANSRIEIASSRWEDFNMGGTGAQLVEETSGSSNVFFAIPPQLINNNGAGLGVASCVSLLRNATATIAANEARAYDGPAGSPVSLRAIGTDANVDLVLGGKGTGYVRFGAYASGATTVSGYISVKDAAGTVRKLAVLT